MLRAIIFDFNGVIVDDEPIHLKLFQQVLAEQGLPLREEDYYRVYIGMDDRECFATVLAEHGRPADSETIAALVRRKAALYQVAIRDHLTLFPGVAALVRAAATPYPLAIASGALRAEILIILEQAGLRDAFRAIVSAEDVTRGKPDPEGYEKALAALNAAGVHPPLEAAECLVVEDTVAGIEAAHAAEMSCLAVTNSYPPEALGAAELVVGSLAEVTLARLEALFR